MMDDSLETTRNKASALLAVDTPEALVACEFESIAAIRAVPDYAVDRGSLGELANLRGRALGHYWRLRRAFALARRALLRLDLQEVSRAVSQIGGLMRSCEADLRIRYAAAFSELRACILVAEDDLPGARELLLTADRAAAEGTISAALLRYIQWMAGANVCAAPQSSPRDSLPPTVLERSVLLSLNAALEFEHLRLTVASHLAAEALRATAGRYGELSPATCLPAVLLAQIAYEQGRVTEAEDLIRPRLALIHETGVLECVLRAGIVLARIAMHQGDSAEALETLRDAETVGQARGWARLISATRAESTRIRLLIAPTGNSLETSGEPARDWSPRPFDSTVPPRYSSVHAALVRLTSASNIERADRYRILMSCLRTGATGGLYRVFLDVATPILGLASSQDDERPEQDPYGDLKPYVGLLLRAATLAHTAPERPIVRARQPLSRRETAILRMIAQGMSNKRIALSLGIAPETVKSHAKSIFLKLGTRTRAQAVARAASMALSGGDSVSGMSAWRGRPILEPQVLRPPERGIRAEGNVAQDLNMATRSRAKAL